MQRREKNTNVVNREDGMFHQVNLEVSMKVFKRNDPDSIRRIVCKIFDQWAAVLKNRSKISILFWVSDGSDILDFTGNLDEKIEWSYFIGCANKDTLKPGEDRDVNLHEVNVTYMENPPVVTYRTVKEIVAAFKEEGHRRYPFTDFQMGIPFDIGPEFARSEFKYRRHSEICTGSGEGEHTFINSYGLLAQDHYPYAGYPDGISRGTPFGAFLGRQANIYLKELGFDYLWLSNGVGFSAYPWSPVGAVYDGTEFHMEKFAETEEKVFDFWGHFRREFPDYPVYTRGTNFSAGMDYAKDAVGLYRIYQAGLNIVPPPNSPWAALNGDYALELVGHLTRNCELPGRNYMFRYYLHDPWWANSPWYDRYGSSPHDIYLPMALSRIDENGRVQPAEILNLLTLDNSFGDMPDSCANEIIPHLLKAEKDCADEAAPFVWVYPFREFTTTTQESDLKKILEGEMLIQRWVAEGFPLSCVVSCDNFRKQDKEIYSRSILVTPVPEAGSLFETEILRYVQDGGKVLFYGSAAGAGEAFRKAAACHLRNVEWVRDTGLAKLPLHKFGYAISFYGDFPVPDNEKEESLAGKVPVIMVNRSDNAEMYNVYSPDLTVETRLKCPLGAPVLIGYDVRLENGEAIYHFPRSVHGECRVYVEQTEGTVSVKERSPVSAKFRRRVEVSGLKHATVRFFGESYCKESVTVKGSSRYNWRDCPGIFEDVDDCRLICSKEYGTYYEVQNYTGSLVCSMPFPADFERGI